MIVLGITLGLALSGGMIVFLIRFARKTIKEGKTVSWPIWTYLWGYLITFPLVLLMLGFRQLLKYDNLREWESALFNALEIAALLPITIHYLVGFIVLSAVWIALLLRTLFKAQNS